LKNGKKKNNAAKAENSFRNAWENKKPVLIFVGVFALLMILFYIAWINPFLSGHIFDPLVRFYAFTSGKILTLLGYQNVVSGTMIRTAVIELNIKRGCDAIEATALFAAAVIAFPVSFRKKIPGLLIGILTLAMINLIRIVTLFIAGIENPGIFNFLHDQLWQVIYIAISVLLLILWLRSVRGGKPVQNAS
jgi:exosortase H (IPTLxxWG-CTERM-specific)